MSILVTSPHPAGAVTVWGAVSEDSSRSVLSVVDEAALASSAGMGLDVKYGCPIYNVFDEIQSFDGKIGADFYFIKTNICFHFRVMVTT